jgi:hypothetical protein
MYSGDGGDPAWAPAFAGAQGRPMEKGGYVYIMASGRNGTLYIGVTSDLVKRVWQHREGVADGFTKRYGCKSWFGSSVTTALRLHGRESCR